MLKRLHLLISLSLLVTLLLAACAEATPTPATGQTSPTTAAVSTAPSQGPANQSVPVPTNSPVATSTVPPTATQTAEATVTSAPATPTATLSLPTATPSPNPTTPTPTLNPGTPTPAVTPSAQVPLLPVRRTGGTLTIGALDSDLKARNYSPYASDLNEVSLHLQRLVWNARLLYRDPVRLDWKPLAAAALPVVDNGGQRFTFTLRDNLNWSDGTPITSSDYIFAFNSALRPENHFPHLAELQRITTISGPDLQTLVFTFNDNYATALQTIGLIEPLPSKIWSRYQFATADRNPEITRPSVVSGPFQPDAANLSFSLVPNYSLSRPNLDRITIKPVSNQGELYDSLRTGVINWTFNRLPSDLLGRFRTLNQLNIYRWTPQDSGRRYIGYNLNNANNPFLQSKAVRQALDHTLDVRSLIAAVESGLATEQPGFLPVSNDYALKGPIPPRFSVRTARDALIAAGYTQRDQDDMLADRLGKAIPALELIYPDGSTEAEAIAVYLRQQYQQLGLMVNLNKLDSATYQKRRASGQYDLDIGLVYLPGASDPDDFRAQFVSKGSLNFTGYSNAQVDSLFADGLKLSPDSNPSQRRQIYEKLQQIVADDSPVFFLYTLQAYTVMTNNVDPGGAGIINLPRWQLAWDAYPAYLNWYLKDVP